MRLHLEQVRKKFEDEKFIFLNVLPKSDYKKLHIKGSENHPLTDDAKSFSKEVEEKFGKNKTFVVYGDHFGLLESYEASKALNDHGLQAENYSGGVQEWFRAGLPVAGTQVGA